MGGRALQHNGPIGPAIAYKQFFARPADQRALLNAMREEWEVGTLLPIQRNRLTGDYDFAVPTAVTDAMSALAAPGKALRGEYDQVHVNQQTGAVEPFDRRMTQDAAGLAGALTLGAGAVPRPANALDMGFRVYHGSPHDFDKFDMSKMGTGEGAQAYGRGLYFAENEAVARGYQQTLSGETFRTASGETWSPDGLQHLNVRVAARDGDLDAAIAKAESLLPNSNEQTRPMLEADLAQLKALRDAGGVTRHQGSLYEAEIDAETDDFLDWDKPLSEQPPKVQEALAKAFPKEWEHWRDRPYYPGQGTMRGNDFFQQMSGGYQMNDQGAVIEKLREAGIPGIRYLDQGSRGKGDGSRNYVVFDDSLIDIKSKR